MWAIIKKYWMLIAGALAAILWALFSRRTKPASVAIKAAKDEVAEARQEAAKEVKEIRAKTEAKLALVDEARTIEDERERLQQLADLANGKLP
jgi:cell shape-determining protein MreC